MSLLVVGTVALDSVHTPWASRENVLGGSAVYFSYAASYFTSVRLVAVVGADWPAEHTQLLQTRRIDTSGLRVVPNGRTFRWRGQYAQNMNDRETLDVQLNVLVEAAPEVPEPFRQTPFAFLANAAPSVQLQVLDHLTGPRLVVADTMDLWIRESRADLLTLLQRVDGLVLNDSEARLLTQEDNMIRAGQQARKLGPKFVVIKKGEHGAMFFSEHETYVLPAYPTERVVDPTGAGDSFAGGMMGYLSEQDDFQPRTLKRAMAYGIVVASFNVEDFSLDRMQQIERPDLELRMEKYQRMLSF